MATRPLLRNVRHRAMITPVPSLHTWLIHTSPSILVNLSSDTGNLANLKAFGYKYFGLAIWRILAIF